MAGALKRFKERGRTRSKEMLRRNARVKAGPGLEYQIDVNYDALANPGKPCGGLPGVC